MPRISDNIEWDYRVKTSVWFPIKSESNTRADTEN